MTGLLSVSQVFRDIMPHFWGRGTAKAGRHGRQEQDTLVDSLRREVGKMAGAHARSTTANMNTAVNALEDFIKETMGGQPPLTVGTLTQEHVRTFERWALDRGKKPNYVALHMRCLRALVNRLGRDGAALFGRVRTANCQTEKRAVGEDTIGLIRNAPLAKQSECRARDIFLMCFYGMGIPFIDLAYMRKSQVRDGYITYYRHKTRRKVRIEIVPEMRELMERLAAGEGPYLLPILTAQDRDAAAREYRLAYRRYSRALGRLSRALGMECRLSSYTPRHTWASIAYKGGADINTIARALGHASTNVTRAYIREIDDTQLARVNRMVCDAVLPPPETLK